MDSAQELADKIADSSALAVEILTRMALQKRTRRELRHSDHAGNEPLQWLKKNFEEVNNGRHPEFSIPKRIEITVPQLILGEESLVYPYCWTQRALIVQPNEGIWKNI